MSRAPTAWRDAAGQARPVEASQGATASLPTRPSRSRLRVLIRRAALPSALLLLALSLALIFLAYLRPDFAFDLANRFILCL